MDLQKVVITGVRKLSTDVLVVEFLHSSGVGRILNTRCPTFVHLLDVLTRCDLRYKKDLDIPGFCHVGIDSVSDFAFDLVSGFPLRDVILPSLIHHE